MARGTEAAEVTPIKATRDPFDFPPNTDSITYMDVEYTFRELTVAETDQAREDSIDDKTKVFDGRLMTRLMICTSSTSPKIDLAKLAKLPQGLYSAVVDLVNELNDPEVLTKKDEKGKEPEPGNS